MGGVSKGLRADGRAPPGIPIKDFSKVFKKVPDSPVISNKPITNLRGGKRAGSGRKRKTEIIEHQSQPVGAPVIEDGTPGAFLIERMNDESVEMKLRLDAAKALLPYCHARMPEPSKQAAADAAIKSAQVGTSWDGLLQ